MDDFSLRELECFLAVAEELSFTRAARRLRLAQPPLSRHVRNLEEKLGAPLFDRSNRRVALTAAGRAFREEARDILVRVSRAGESARRAARGENERLRVGFVSAVLSPELVGIFSGFRRAHPEIQLGLHDRLPAEQVQALEREELDVGFVGIAPERLPPNLEVTPWRDEPLMAFVPPDHPLAEAKGVALAELADEPFVMISAEAAPAFTSHLHALCREAGFRPRVVQEASRAQAVAAMTVAGSGVSVLPASLHRITQNGVALRMPGGDPVCITHVVAHRSRPTLPTSAFLERLRPD